MKFDNRRRTREAIRTSTRNAIKCSHGLSESPEHRSLKCFVCNRLYELGMNFHTEASLYGGGRADIVIEEWGVIIEVLHTESRKEFLEKDYRLPAIPFYTADNRDYLLTVLQELLFTGGSCAEYYAEREVYYG